MQTQVFYYLYKTTNLVNGKIYIGKHKTKNPNDGYIGSGKLLKRAIVKYGRENFKFEILQWFDNEELLNVREKELVTEEFCLRKDNYNLCVGGRGGFSYIHREIDMIERNRNTNAARDYSKTDWSKREMPDGYARKGYETRVKTGNQYFPSTKGRTFSKQSHNSGSENSQFGTFWITNGSENAKCKSDADIPVGWYRGRKKIVAPFPLIR
jgi:Putative endonuclease segE, GIY-YIG domain